MIELAWMALAAAMVSLPYPAAAAGGAAGAPAQGVSEDLDLVWTCPLHREITEAEAGRCDLCERELIQTLVTRAWSCPLHAVISEPAPGRCPICDRELFLITEEVRYACPMHPEVESHEAGSCHLCHMALEAVTAARPHQDHNPKHGGMFFMAPDSWHHLEGTYPEEGLFRLYLYDNFSQPISAEPFKGRAVLKEVFDADSKQTRELLAYPLLASSDGAYLEASVGRGSLPREITAKVQFERGGPFERFDFVFAGLSEDVEIPRATDAAGDELAIPETPRAIVDGIASRNDEVRELVSSGALDQIYLPALQAKDFAVALESHLGERSEDEQRVLTWALKQLVRSAWLLDDYGDLGNREKVFEAYDLFDEAVSEIRSLYP